MARINIDHLNKQFLKATNRPLEVKKIDYPDIKIKGGKLLDKNGKSIGTKGDMYTKQIIENILTNPESSVDLYPRPHYEDGQKAHTISLNHGMTTYDCTKNEMPVTTLRQTAIKSSIGELLWIYRDASNDLDMLKDKYNVSWWDQWDIGNRTIGATYGETIKRHYNMEEWLDNLKNNPDSRHHMINLWQVEDFKDPNGLPPCAFLTEWNVRHGDDGVDYLDMMLNQRSSDFVTAGAINQTQYMAFLYMVANHCGYKPGRFSWCYDNIQIYDRHIEPALELLRREPIDCEPTFWINPEKKNFFDLTQDDVKIKDYPTEKVKQKNPQLKLPLGI